MMDVDSEQTVLTSNRLFNFILYPWPRSSFASDQNHCHCRVRELSTNHLPNPISPLFFRFYIFGVVEKSRRLISRNYIAVPYLIRPPNIAVIVKTKENSP